MRAFLLSLGILGAAAFAAPGTLLAHPGNTDAYGCHTCRTNCANWGLRTGEYHCHTPKSLPQPKPSVKSTYGEEGTGYTEPRAIPAKTEPALRASTETPQPSQPVERVPSQAAKETPRLQPAGGEPAEPLPAIVPAFGEAPPAFTASEDALPGKRSFAHAVISAVVSLLVQNPLVRLF